MAIGIPEYPNADIEATELPINIYLNSFPFHPNCLNFSANKGSSATNIYAESKGKNVKKYELENKTPRPIVSCCITNGILAINIAFAGVGTPINESLWRVSILNLASLIAEKTGISNTI